MNIFHDIWVFITTSIRIKDCRVHTINILVIRVFRNSFNYYSIMVLDDEVSVINNRTSSVIVPKIKIIYNLV